MKLNHAVLRLIQTGDENSAVWQRIGKSIDKLAETLAMYFPGDGKTNNLPHDVRFQHWPSGEYNFEFRNRSGLAGSVMRNNKYGSFVLDLCRIIANGWLDEVSAYLEEEAHIIIEVEQGIDKFAGRG